MRVINFEHQCNRRVTTHQRLRVMWALFCPGNNLEPQEKVHEELEEVFRDWQGPASVQQLQYLDRIMKEAIRLYPTVPVISSRSTNDVNIGEARFVECVDR